MPRLVVFDAREIEGPHEVELVVRALLSPGRSGGCDLTGRAATEGRPYNAGQIRNPESRATLSEGPDLVCIHNVGGRLEREALAWRLHPFLPFIAGLERSSGLLVASRHPWVEAPAYVPLSAPLSFGRAVRGDALLGCTLDLSDAPGASRETRLLLAHLSLPEGSSARIAAARHDAFTSAAAHLSRRFSTLCRRAGRDPTRPPPDHGATRALITADLGFPADLAPSPGLPIMPSPELEQLLATLPFARDLFRLAQPRDPGHTSPEGRTSLALGLCPSSVEMGGLVASRASVEIVSDPHRYRALVLDLVLAPALDLSDRVHPIHVVPWLPPELDPINAKGPVARRYGRFTPNLLERARLAIEEALTGFGQPSDLTRTLRGTFTSGLAPGAPPTHRATCTPTTRTALLELIARAEAPLRPVAMGCAMSAIIDNRDLRLDLRELRGVSFDRDRHGKPTCVVRSGTSFGQVNAALRADTATQTIHDDWCLVNQPGYAGLSFIGCMSVGGHGSGTRLGALSSTVSWLRVATRDANGRACERVLDADQPELFRAALVGLGLCGVITELASELQPAFRVRELRHLTTWPALVAGRLDELIDWNEAAANEHRGTPHSFEIWVNVYTGKAVVGRRWKTLAACSGRRASAQLWDGWGSVETLFDQVENRVSHPGPAVASLLDSALDGTVHGNEVVMSAAAGLDFGTTNNFEVLSSAVAVRGPELVPAMARVIALARSLAFEVSDEPAFLASPVGIRFVRNQPTAERPFLAPQFDYDSTRDHTPLARLTAMIELPGLATVRGTRRALDTIIMDLVQRFGARPHWGQYLPPGFDPAALEAVYPPDELRAFREARRTLDPTGLFESDFSRALGL